MLSKVSVEIILFFSESVYINNNIRKNFGSTCSEKLDCSFFINIKGTKQTKEKFVGAYKENTCAKSQRNIINHV